MIKIRQSKVFLQYGAVGEVISYRVAVSEEQAEKFVSLETQRPVGISQAHDFGTAVTAFEYSGGGEGLHVRHVSVEYSFEQIERLTPCKPCHWTGSISEIVDHDADYNTVWETRKCSLCGGSGKSEG